MFKEYNEMVDEAKNRPPPERFDKNGNVRMCNQGHYKFFLNENEDET